MFTDDIIIKNVSYVIFVSSTSDEKHNYSGTLSENELIFKLNGKSRIEYGNKIYEEKEGCVRFLPQTDIYTTYKTKTIEPGDCIDIFFKTQNPINVKPFCIDTKNHKEISRLFKKVENIWRLKPVGYNYLCIGLLYEIISLLQGQNRYINKQKLNKIMPGIDFINENFTKNIHLENASMLCNMSYEYFKRIFIHCYGVSPKAYILQRKIDYACDLIKTKRYTISEAAELSGFSNAHYFSRIFKKTMGVPPVKYKNNCT